MSLWDSQVVAEVCQGKAIGGKWSAARVEIDSRRVQKGDLFVALKGERLDGHDFIGDAFAKGAAAALVSLKPGDAAGPLVAVGDTLTALRALAAHARGRAQGAVVGLTGSVGKTGTKEMLRLALSAHGHTFASHGNYNNHIGVPLNLANLPPQYPYAVFEMGMNHAGEISALTRMVRPQVALVTGVEPVHLEFFGSEDGIADAKAEIFEGLMPGGIAVLNRDNRHFERLKAAARAANAARIITCGEHPESDCRLLEYKTRLPGCEVTASIFGQELQYSLYAVGRHWAFSSVLALAVAAALGQDAGKSARALVVFSEPDGRGQALRLPFAGGEIWLIDDSYNASPAAMQAAFAKTAEIWAASGRRGRKIALLGDMLELGADSPRLHAELAAGLKRYGFSLVFTAGALMESLYQALPATIRAGHAKSPNALLPALRHGLAPGDVVLIKGSHGSKMHELAALLKQEFAAVKESAHAV